MGNLKTANRTKSGFIRLVLPGLIWLQSNGRAAPAQIKSIDLERGNLARGDTLT